MKAERKIFIFITVTAIILCAGLAYADIKRYDVPLENSPSIGPEDAKITIIEFLDYQ